MYGTVLRDREFGWVGVGHVDLEGVESDQNTLYKDPKEPIKTQGGKVFGSTP